MSQLDPTRSYKSLKLSGSLYPSGVELTIGVYVTIMVQALYTGTKVQSFSNGNYSWSANLCGEGIDANTLSMCGCSMLPSSLRYGMFPCTTTGDWGGMIGTTACAPSSQSITLTIQ